MVFNMKDDTRYSTDDVKRDIIENIAYIFSKYGYDVENVFIDDKDGEIKVSAIGARSMKHSEEMLF